LNYPNFIWTVSTFLFSQFPLPGDAINAAPLESRSEAAVVRYAFGLPEVAFLPKSDQPRLPDEGAAHGNIVGRAIGNEEIGDLKRPVAPDENQGQINGIPYRQTLSPRPPSRRNLWGSLAGRSRLSSCPGQRIPGPHHRLDGDFWPHIPGLEWLGSQVHLPHLLRLPGRTQRPPGSLPHRQAGIPRVSPTLPHRRHGWSPHLHRITPWWSGIFRHFSALRFLIRAWLNRYQG